MRIGQISKSDVGKTMGVRDQVAAINGRKHSVQVSKGVEEETARILKLRQQEAKDAIFGTGEHANNPPPLRPRAMRTRVSRQRYDVDGTTSDEGSSGDELFPAMREFYGDDDDTQSLGSLVDNPSITSENMHYRMGAPKIEEYYSPIDYENLYPFIFDGIYEDDSEYIPSGLKALQDAWNYLWN